MAALRLYMYSNGNVDIPARTNYVGQYAGVGVKQGFQVYCFTGDKLRLY